MQIPSIYPQDPDSVDLGRGAGHVPLRQVPWGVLEHMDHAPSSDRLCCKDTTAVLPHAASKYFILLYDSIWEWS